MYLIRPGKFATRFVWSCVFLFASVSFSVAQTSSSTVGPSLSTGPAPPPLDVPFNKLPARDPNAIEMDGWLLYPTFRLYSQYSDNLFLSPQSPFLNVTGIAITPSLVAEWTNGIHTTTFYGNIDRQDYPTANEVNTLDGRAGFTQRYEALRDLIFTVNGNYTHQTWSTGLQNSIQTGSSAPATSVLPNGNTVLPNGTILSPSGQTVGQVSAPSGSNIPLSVNPFDQYTGTFTIDKTFNRGILSLAGTVNRTDYETESSLSTRGRTVTENAGFWLGPLFYFYSSGSIGNVVIDATQASTTSYRIIGGLGTRQFGLFRGSMYFGHQGSEGSTDAAGDVYGGAVSYYPTPKWTIAGSIDETVNIANIASAASANLALTLPGLVGVQIPVGSSTRTTTSSLQTSYEITSQWSTVFQLGYTAIEYVDSSRRDNSWIVDTLLKYDVRRDLSITWEYRYRDIVSNAPFVSAVSNTAIVGATYKF
jgi:hypothetical protein